MSTNQARDNLPAVERAARPAMSAVSPTEPAGTTAGVASKTARSTGLVSALPHGAMGYFLAPLPGLIVRISASLAYRYARICAIGAHSGSSRTSMSRTRLAGLQHFLIEE